jgi:uncharacterized protein YejL (UPF0352 family)
MTVNLTSRFNKFIPLFGDKDDDRVRLYIHELQSLADLNPLNNFEYIQVEFEDLSIESNIPLVMQNKNFQKKNKYVSDDALHPEWLFFFANVATRLCCISDYPKNENELMKTIPLLMGYKAKSLENLVAVIYDNIATFSTATSANNSFIRNNNELNNLISVEFKKVDEIFSYLYGQLCTLDDILTLVCNIDKEVLTDLRALADMQSPDSHKLQAISDLDQHKQRIEMLSSKKQELENKAGKDIKSQLENLDYAIQLWNMLNTETITDWMNAVIDDVTKKSKLTEFRYVRLFKKVHKNELDLVSAKHVLNVANDYIINTKSGDIEFINIFGEVGKVKGIIEKLENYLIYEDPRIVGQASNVGWIPLIKVGMLDDLNFEDAKDIASRCGGTTSMKVVSNYFDTLNYRLPEKYSWFDLIDNYIKAVTNNSLTNIFNTELNNIKSVIVYNNRNGLQEMILSIPDEGHLFPVILIGKYLWKLSLAGISDPRLTRYIYNLLIILLNMRQITNIIFYMYVCRILPQLKIQPNLIQHPPVNLKVTPTTHIQTDFRLVNLEIEKILCCMDLVSVHMLNYMLTLPFDTIYNLQQTTKNKIVNMGKQYTLDLYLAVTKYKEPKVLIPILLNNSPINPGIQINQCIDPSLHQYIQGPYPPYNDNEINSKFMSIENIPWKDSLENMGKNFYAALISKRKKYNLNNLQILLYIGNILVVCADDVLMNIDIFEFIYNFIQHECNSINPTSSELAIVMTLLLLLIELNKAKRNSEEISIKKILNEMIQTLNKYKIDTNLSSLVGMILMLITSIHTKDFKTQIEFKNIISDTIPSINPNFNMILENIALNFMKDKDELLQKLIKPFNSKLSDSEIYIFIKRLLDNIEYYIDKTAIRSDEDKINKMFNFLQDRLKNANQHKIKKIPFLNEVQKIYMRSNSDNKKPTFDELYKILKNIEELLKDNVFVLKWFYDEFRLNDRQPPTGDLPLIYNLESLEYLAMYDMIRSITTNTVKKFMEEIKDMDSRLSEITDELDTSTNNLQQLESNAILSPSMESKEYKKLFNTYFSKLKLENGPVPTYYVKLVLLANTTKFMYHKELQGFIVETTKVDDEIFTNMNLEETFGVIHLFFINLNNNHYSVHEFNYNINKYFVKTLLEAHVKKVELQPAVSRFFAEDELPEEEKYFRKTTDGLLYMFDENGNEVLIESNTQIYDKLKIEDKCLGTGFKDAEVIINGKPTNLKCADYLRDCLRGNNIEKCKEYLKHPQFWDEALKEVDNMLPDLMMITLKEFQFEVEEYNDTVAQRPLKRFKSVEAWLKHLSEMVEQGNAKLTEEDLRLINNNDKLKHYLRLIVKKMNSNPFILNRDYTGKSQQTEEPTLPAWPRLSRMGIPPYHKPAGRFPKQGLLFIKKTLEEKARSLGARMGIPEFIPKNITIKIPNLTLTGGAPESIPDMEKYLVNYDQQLSGVLEHQYIQILGRLNRAKKGITTNDSKKIDSMLKNFKQAETKLVQTMLYLEKYLALLEVHGNRDNSSILSMDNLKEFVDTRNTYFVKVVNKGNKIIDILTTMVDLMNKQ